MTLYIINSQMRRYCVHCLVFIRWWLYRNTKHDKRLVEMWYCYMSQICPSRTYNRTGSPHQTYYSHILLTENDKRQTLVDKAIHEQLKIGQHELYWKPRMNSGRVNSSCSTSTTCRAIFTKISVISHEKWKKGGLKFEADLLSCICGISISVEYMRTA